MESICWASTEHLNMHCSLNYFQSSKILDWRKKVFKWTVDSTRKVYVRGQKLEHSSKCGQCDHTDNYTILAEDKKIMNIQQCVDTVCPETRQQHEHPGVNVVNVPICAIICSCKLTTHIYASMHPITRFFIIFFAFSLCSGSVALVDCSRWLSTSDKFKLTPHARII